MTDVLASSVREYLDRLSAGSAVPGGGSAAALAAAMGVALVSMVARISAKRAGDRPEAAILMQLLPELDQLRSQLGRLSQDDIDAYRRVIDARKAGAPRPELEAAYARAAGVPLDTARAADRALELLPQVSERAWEMTRSDLDAGRALLEVGVFVALANVEVNLPDLAADTRAQVQLAYAELASRRPH